MRQKEFDEYRIEIQIKHAQIRWIVNQLAKEVNDPRLEQIRRCTNAADRLWAEFERISDQVADPDEWFGKKWFGKNLREGNGEITGISGVPKGHAD